MMTRRSLLGAALLVMLPQAMVQAHPQVVPAPAPMTAQMWDGARQLAQAPLTGTWQDPSGEAWAVGPNGKVLRRTPGAEWERVPSGTPEWLGAVWGSGPNDVWPTRCATRGGILVRQAQP